MTLQMDKGATLDFYYTCLTNEDSITAAVGTYVYTYTYTHTSVDRQKPHCESHHTAVVHEVFNTIINHLLWCSDSEPTGIKQLTDLVRKVSMCKDLKQTGPLLYIFTYM